MRSLLFLAIGAFLAPLPQSPTKDTAGHRGGPVLTPEMVEVLSHMRIVEIQEPGMTSPVKVLRIGGVNVQILNENTDSEFSPSGPTMQNGLGNLILGWNSPQSPYYVDRSGSHNLVLGDGNGYMGVCSIVSGKNNSVVSDSAVLGGSASSAASGGAVIGANDSQAANHGVVVGGSYNGAGYGGPGWPLSGGYTGSFGDVVVGGEGNSAIGGLSVVGGGYYRHADGYHDWVAGSLLEDD